MENEAGYSAKPEVKTAEKTTEDITAYIEERMDNLKSEYAPTITKKVGIVELKRLTDMLKKARIDELKKLKDWITEDWNELDSKGPHGGAGEEASGSEGEGAGEQGQEI